MLRAKSRSVTQRPLDTEEKASQERGPKKANSRGETRSAASKEPYLQDGGGDELQVSDKNTSLSFRELRTESFSPRIYSDAKELLNESTYIRLAGGLTILRSRASEVGRSALFALYGIYCLLSYRWHPELLPLSIANFSALYGRLWGTQFTYDDILSFLAWTVSLTEPPSFTEADARDMGRMVLLPQGELAHILSDKMDRYPYVF